MSAPNRGVDEWRVLVLGFLVALAWMLLGYVIGAWL